MIYKTIHGITFKNTAVFIIPDITFSNLSSRKRVKDRKGETET